MRKSGPIQTEYSYARASKSVVDRIEGLTKRKKLGHISIHRENVSISLRKGAK